MTQLSNLPDASKLQVSDKLFISDLWDQETQLLLRQLGAVSNPSPHYLEIGIQFGGTFRRVLKHLRYSRRQWLAVGVDLFEDLHKELQAYEVGWPQRSQTHRVINKEGRLGTTSHTRLTNALYEQGYTGFRLLQGYSDEVLPTLEERFDVCFIDGNHTYAQARRDFENCYRLSNPRASFLLHNTLESESRTFYLDGGPYKLAEELRHDTRVVQAAFVQRMRLFVRKD